MLLDYDWDNTKHWIEIHHGVDFCPEGILRIDGRKFDPEGKEGHLHVDFMLLDVEEDIRKKYPDFDRQIHTLLFFGLPGLENLAPIRYLSNVRSLGIKDCSNVDCCATLDREINLELENFYLSNNHRNISFDRLPSAHTIKNLTLAHADGIRVDGYPDAFPQLQSLYLCNLFTLFDLEGFRSFPNLERLKIKDCLAFKSLEKGENYKNLKELIVDIQGVTDLRPIKRDMPNLQRLELLNACELKSLDGLKGLQCLEEFTATDCGNLSDISALRHLTNLTAYQIRWTKPEPNPDFF